MYRNSSKPIDGKLYLDYIAFASRISVKQVKRSVCTITFFLSYLRNLLLSASYTLSVDVSCSMRVTIELIQLKGLDMSYENYIVGICEVSAVFWLIY